jgi:SAM-dependent methyltransferase
MLKPHYNEEQLENIRERLCPALTDVDYLPLKDLRDLMGRFAPRDAIDVLDFGCGNSPYAELFPNARYVRADFLDAPGRDFSVTEDARTGIPDGLFDLVISTQVAEHLPDPKSYFDEAYRVLRPGGRMIVTTHGVWEDHGAPFDFQRWTADGICRDLRRSGFDVNGVYKLTAGERFFLYQLLRWLNNGGFNRPRLLSRVGRRLARDFVKLGRPCLHRWADRLWSDCTIAEGDNLRLHRSYLIVGVEVTKRGI